jgi:hypothetical protein
VFKVCLFDCGSQIYLAPDAVVGGDYTFWDPTNGQLLWRAKPRPLKVSPPYGCSELEAKQWDGHKAADERQWFVQHVCGLTAAEVVEERRRRKGA